MWQGQAQKEAQHLMEQMYAAEAGLAQGLGCTDPARTLVKFASMNVEAWRKPSSASASAFALQHGSTADPLDVTVAQLACP